MLFVFTNITKQKQTQEEGEYSKKFKVNVSHDDTPHLRLISGKEKKNYIPKFFDKYVAIRATHSKTHIFEVMIVVNSSVTLHVSNE